MQLIGGSKTICYNTNTHVDWCKDDLLQYKHICGLMPSEMMCMRDTGPNKKCTDDKNKNWKQKWNCYSAIAVWFLHMYVGKTGILVKQSRNKRSFSAVSPYYCYHLCILHRKLETKKHELLLLLK